MTKKKATKDLIVESFKELLKVRSFEKITVGDITDKCGISRRSFYNNFRDKNEVATWFYISRLRDFTENIEHARLSDLIRFSTEVVREELRTVTELDKYKGQNNFRDSLCLPMADVYEDFLTRFLNVEPTVEMRQDIEFFVGGQIAFVARIINSSDLPTPEEAFDLYIRCIPSSLEPFL